MEAGRPGAAAGVLHAAPAAARLADVVRGARRLSPVSMVHRVSGAPVGERPTSIESAPHQSVSRGATAVRSRDGVPIPIQRRRDASRNGRVVAAGTTGIVLPRAHALDGGGHQCAFQPLGMMPRAVVLIDLICDGYRDDL